MGIDLIENSEMSALSPSRLGNKCFVDDDSYANLFGIRGHRYKDIQRAKQVSKGGTWNIDPAKEKDCKEVGFDSTVIRFDQSISEAELITENEKINEDRNIDGLIVQLPLPKHINEKKNY